MSSRLLSPSLIKNFLLPYSSSTSSPTSFQLRTFARIRGRITSRPSSQTTSTSASSSNTTTTNNTTNNSNNDKNSAKRSDIDDADFYASQMKLMKEMLDKKENKGRLTSDQIEVIRNRIALDNENDDNYKEKDENDDDNDKEDDEDGMPQQIYPPLSTAQFTTLPRETISHLSSIHLTLTELLKKTGRTPKQIDKSWEDTMGRQMKLRNIRADIKTFAELEGRIVDGVDSQNDSHTSGKKKFTTKSSSFKPAIVYGPTEALALLKHRYLPHYTSSHRILSELKVLLPNFKPDRILDFGSGAGPSTSAALSVYGSDGVEVVCGVDVSLAQREAYSYMIDKVHSSTSDSGIEAAQTNKMRIETSATLPIFPLPPSSDDRNEAKLTLHASQTLHNLHAPPPPSTPLYNLILTSHVLHELPNLSHIESTVCNLWRQLDDGGCLVFVEPGTPEGFGCLMGVRGLLLGEKGRVSEGGYKVFTNIGDDDENEDEEEGKSMVNGMEWEDDGDWDEMDNDPEYTRIYPKGHPKHVPDHLIYESIQANKHKLPPPSSNTNTNKSKTKGIAKKQTLTMKYIKNDVNLLAPCTNKLSCPLTTDPDAPLRFCTFGQNLFGAASLGARKQDKISYLVFQKTLNKGVDSELEKQTSMLNGKITNILDAARITRSPRKNAGHVIFEACHSGSVSSVTITKSSHGKSIYKKARKAKWGGLWVLGEFDDDEYEQDENQRDGRYGLASYGRVEEGGMERGRDEVTKQRIAKYGAYDVDLRANILGIYKPTKSSNGGKQYRKPRNENERGGRGKKGRGERD